MLAGRSYSRYFTIRRSTGRSRSRGVGHELKQRDRVFAAGVLARLGLEAFHTCGAARSGRTVAIGESSASCLLEPVACAGCRAAPV